MNLEAGEYFVVTRGPELRDMSGCASLLSPFDGFQPEQSGDKKPQYDRSHEGRIFQAIEVCGNMIAAKIVWPTSDIARLGSMRSLNLDELSIWPVTRRYAESMGVPVEVPA